MGEMSQVFEDAADLIDRYGHTKRSYGSYDTGFCAIGAVRQTIFGSIVLPFVTSEGVRVQPEDQSKYDLYNACINHLRDDVRDRAGVRSIVSWNDLETTTPAVVGQTFRNLADATR